MLRGTQKSKLDNKGRVVVPSSHRDSLFGKEQQPLVITGHPGGYAILLQLVEYEKLETKISKMPERDISARYYKNVLIGMADDRVMPDKLGRIKIPPTLCEHANLNQEVLFFGMRNHLQLWDQGNWDELKQKIVSTAGTGILNAPQGWDEFSL